MTVDLDQFDAVGLAGAIRAGQLGGLEVLEAAVGRIEERNPVLNAVVATRLDAAFEEVRRGVPDGPLAGVPFLVKDLNCDVAGLPATRGSRLFADVVATEDCELVARYRRAGLVILGNTNSPELGKNASTEPLLHGPTRNPWERTHSSGGSSGGSAAAVAGGIVAAAHGNDGGGSIRIPASACGLVGLKPTRGRTPTHPIPASFSYPLGIGHALTRTVRDSAALLDAVAGPLPGDPYPAPGGPASFLADLGVGLGRLRIGFTTVAADGRAAEPACAAAVAAAARCCEQLGHMVDEAAPRIDPAAVSNVMTVVMNASSQDAVRTRLAELGRELADDDLEPFSMFLHERSSQLSALDLVRALQDLERVSRSVAGFYRDHDLWLTPTLAAPVPALGVLDTTDISKMIANAARFTQFTAVCNVTGQPAISVPFGADDGGLPLGVQFVGAHGSESVLLRLAAQLEAAAPWATLAPWPPPGA